MEMATPIYALVILFFVFLAVYAIFSMFRQGVIAMVRGTKYCEFII